MILSGDDIMEVSFLKPMTGEPGTPPTPGEKDALLGKKIKLPPFQVPPWNLSSKVLLPVPLLTPLFPKLPPFSEGQGVLEGNRCWSKSSQ